MAAIYSDKPNLARGISEFSFSSMPTQHHESVALLEWLDESLNKQVQVEDDQCEMILGLDPHEAGGNSTVGRNRDLSTDVTFPFPDDHEDLLDMDGTNFMSSMDDEQAYSVTSETHSQSGRSASTSVPPSPQQQILYDNVKVKQQRKQQHQQQHVQVQSGRKVEGKVTQAQAKSPSRRVVGGLSTVARKRKVQRDKERRVQRKNELGELRVKVRRLEDDRKLFMRTISELEEEASLLESMQGGKGLTSLTQTSTRTSTTSMLSVASEADRRERSQNNALRQQVESHRAFARRIEQLMAATQTTNSELQTHLNNVHQLELRQLCVDSCDSALQQGLGLLRDSVVVKVQQPELVSQLSLPPPTSTLKAAEPHASSEWKLAIVDGDHNTKVLFRQPSDTANRLQLRMDVDLPTSTLQTLALLHGHLGNATEDRGLQAIYEATECASQQLYTDEDWNAPYNTSNYAPKVCATYTRENLNGTLNATVAALMRTRLKLPQEALRLPTATAAARTDVVGCVELDTSNEEGGGEGVECFANVSANASHLLPDPTRMSPPVMQDLMTNVHLIYGLVQQSSSAEGGRTNKGSRSRLTILDASPWHGMVRSGFGLTNTSDGTPVFVGAWAKRAKATCRWLVRAAEQISAETDQVKG